MRFFANQARKKCTNDVSLDRLRCHFELFVGAINPSSDNSRAAHEEANTAFSLVYSLSGIGAHSFPWPVVINHESFHEAFKYGGD